MSKDNVNNVIDYEDENTTTTTRFQQTKNKVSEFVKKHKTAIGFGFGATALIGAYAVVNSLTKTEEENDVDIFRLAVTSKDPEDHTMLVIDPDGDSTLYAEVDSDGELVSNDDSDNSDDNVTESTE